jgi:hypothetical protein
MWRPSATRQSEALLLVAAVAVAGCGSHSSSSTHVVRVTGEIGPVHVDRSDRAAVVAFAGQPDTVVSGRAPGSFPYRALGYDCAPRMNGGVQLAAHAPVCRTAFFFDGRTGKLETFYTSSRKFSEGHGVRIGMTQARAELLLHRRLTVGCTTALYFESSTGSLSIEFAGGTERGTAIKDARVDAFVVHGHRRDAGIFDCL